MAISVRLLRNHGATIHHPERGRGSGRSRFVRPNGYLSIGESAVMLKTNPMKLYRLILAGEVAVRTIGGEKRIALRDVKRMKRERVAQFDRRSDRMAS